MTKKLLQYLLLAVTIFFLPLCTISAQTSGEEQEVYLTFRYQNLVGVYILSYYKDGEFYLPHNELFNTLNIDASRDPASNRITGQFIEKGGYVINLDELQAAFDDRQLELDTDDFIIRELDIYLKPYIFSELFSLDFNVDFNDLRLQLVSTHTLPIESQQLREQQRQRALRTHADPFADYYTLRYDRNRQRINGGFIDYNLSANITEGNNSYLYTTGFGMEILGGDLQGNIFGSWSQQVSSFRSDNLRWRYALHGRDWLTQVTAGQTVSGGLVQSSYSGVQLTNEPVQPRFLFDDYAFTGTTTPQSEVELYRNNTLIDYQTADETGNYRFLVPLTYGTTQYDIRTYSPTGQVSQRLTRLQVPFNFVPPGEINYTLEAGKLDNPIPGTTDRGFLTKANVRTGLNNWLSAQSGVEYYENFHGNDLPTFSGALTSRIMTNYLVTVEAATRAFYRVNAGMIHHSSASIDFSFTNFTQQGGIYNPGRNLNSLRFNLFTPFEAGGLPFFFRTTFIRDERELSEIYRYNVSLSTRVNRTSFRFGYRDTQPGRFQIDSTPLARLSASATYIFPRGRNIPGLISGAFLSLRTNYAAGMNRFEDAELQLSQNILQRGRLQFTAGRNFLGNFNFASLNLSIDFDSFRSNSVGRVTRGRSSMTQSVRGSLGFDSGNRRLVPENRQQVGRSAVAVRMFVDNNNSGKFDEGDELIEERAIRIERAGSTVKTAGGITYLSQLQPYRQYNMSVNKNAIRNPLLVPLVDNFSFITDPNQYKVIDIPLYLSGVIDGNVQREVHGTSSGVAGLRLILEQTNSSEDSNPYREEIRTFSDGSFYAYEIHPGTYTLKVDSIQLELLNVVSVPEKMEIDIKATAEGDYLDNLGFTLHSPDAITESSLPETQMKEHVHQNDDIPDETTPATKNPDFTEIDIDDFVIQRPGTCNYPVQFGSYKGMNFSIEMADKASKQFNLPVRLYYNVNTSMYALRTEPVETLTSSVKLLGKLKEIDPGHQYAILSKCNNSDSKYRMVPLQFLISFITYSDSTRAAAFAAEMEKSFGLELKTRFLEKEESYLLYMGPYSNQREPDRYFKLLGDLKLPVEPVLIRDPETLYDMKLSFKLQNANQIQETELPQLLVTCTELLDEGCLSVQEQEGEHYIFIDREFRSWSSFLRFYSTIREKSGMDDLIFYIVSE